MTSIVTPTTEESIFHRAERLLENNRYGIRTPAASDAWARDQRWFTENANAGVRIRRVHPGECGVSDAWLREGPHLTVWLIVLHHIRLCDLRFSTGIGVWLTKSTEANAEARAATLKIEARRLVRRSKLPADLQHEDEDEDEDNDEAPGSPFAPHPHDI